MANTLERQDYPAMLPALQPHQAVDILNDRVRQVGKLNNVIAEWLQERRRLEEQYSAGMRKLARKQVEGVDLGIFSVAWDTLTDAANTMADSHSALATKIEVDVERPLRDFTSSNREMQAMATIQGNLSSMARDVDRSQQKTDKLRERGDRAEAGKVASANSELDNAHSQWESQAPYIFENLQAVDEMRLNLLRDVLTQFQTHEVDMVQKSQATAEHCLNVLLSLQTQDEIKTFAMKAVQGMPRADRPQRASVIPNLATASRAPPSSSSLTPTISHPDDSSQRSGSVTEDKDKRKSRFGGLKRFGTVVGGRKRDSKVPSTLAPMAESPERKPRSSPFNSFSTRLGRSKETPVLEPPQSPPPRERPRSPLRIGSEALMAPSARTSQAPSSSPAPASRAEPTPHLNGTPGATGSQPPRLSAPILNGSHQNDLADLDPPKPHAREPQPELSRDSEGFSLPPQGSDPISQAQADATAAGESTTPAFNVNIRNAPIQEETGESEAALASLANKLQAPPTVGSRVGTVRGRRVGRPMSAMNSIYLPNPEPIIEPAKEPIAEPTSPPVSPMAQSATHVASEEPQTVSPVSPQDLAIQQSGERAGLPVAPSPSGTFMSGTGAPSTFSPFASTLSPQIPLRPESRAMFGSEHATDAGSIRSGRSLTSTGSQGLKHPELHETGLNSSIVETVSARFENGKIVSSSLIGEIALAHNAADFTSPFGSENIRLENFASLEKVAPNPAFIAPTPGREGEYAVNLSNLAKTQVAFKYQVRTEEAGAQAPLLVTPAFRIEPTQASIIVSYSLNPSFNMHGRESITLSGVMLALTLEGAKATACQSKPAGTFAREKNMMWWQLGDITLRVGAAPEKLLARFTTESEAKTGSVETRWEIGGEHAQSLGSGLTVSLQSPAAAVEGADPFADEHGGSGLTAVWKGVAGPRKLVSGVYAAK